MLLSKICKQGHRDAWTWAYLIKVQTYDDVGPLCLLIDHFQEVNMSNVWRIHSQGDNNIQNRSRYCKTVISNQFGAFFACGYGKDQMLQPRRWWCLQAAALPLRQTGWSSGRSGGTETLPSMDYRFQDPWAQETTQLSGRMEYTKYSIDFRITWVIIIRHVSYFPKVVCVLLVMWVILQETTD